jgi:Ran GTPase-activating protein (RanGAP) involved in mRNA processing and transport
MKKVLLIACAVSSLYSWGGKASFEEAGEHQLRELRERLVKVTGAEVNHRRVAIEALEKLLPDLPPQDQQTVKTLLPKLKAPEEFINQDPTAKQTILEEAELKDTHPVFKPLLEIIQALKLLPEKLQEYGQKLKGIYSGFIEGVVGTTPQARESLLEPTVELSGIGLGHYVITQQMARELLSINEEGKLQLINTTGTSPVIAKLNQEEGWGIHFKADGRRSKPTLPPLQPGLEAAVYWFYQLLFGQGITPTCALALNNVRITNANGTMTQDYVVQASSTVFGTDFQEWMIAYSKGQKPLQEISVSSLSTHFMASLLINFGDAKADNYRLNQQNELIGIDNDHVFVDEFRKSDKILDTSGEHYMGIRCLFYAWSEFLKAPIDATVKQYLSQILGQPQGDIQFLSRWLQRLALYNQEVARLKKQGYLSAFWFEPQTLIHRIEEFDELGNVSGYKERIEIQPALFPVLLPQNLIAHLQAKLYKLQSVLTNPWVKTHSQVFKQMNPFTEAYYRHVGTKVKATQPMEALSYIYQGIRSMEAELQQGGEDMKKLLSVKDPIPLTYSHRPQTIQALALSLAERSEIRVLTSSHQRMFVEKLIPLLDDQLPESWCASEFLAGLIDEGLSVTALEWFIARGCNINATDGKGQSLLHHAVLYGQKDPRHALQQITVLLKNKADIELQDKQHLTPLSLAMATSFLEGAKQLILVGAGEKANFRIASAFYKRHIQGKGPTDLSFAFEVLRRRNSKLDWHLTLERLLPVEGEGLHVKTASYDERVFPLTLKNKLFNAQGSFIRQNTYGRRDVTMLEIEGYRLYLKKYPELPGIEEAVGRLTRKLIGHGAPHVELINLNNEPVLISQAITGDTLQDVLNRNPKKLEQLDAKSLSEMLLVAMLVNPEDGKPDNYIAQPLPDNSNLYRIQGIDNDHAFVPAVAREQKEGWLKSHEVVQVKTVLYCLDQMLQPIHPEVRIHFMMLDPVATLKSWLVELKDVNDRFVMLFGLNQVQQFFKKHDCFMGIPFKENTVPYLYQKMLRMQRALEENEQITHLELLTKLEPQLGKRYQQVLEKAIPVKARFEEVDGVFYSKAIAGHHLTKVNSRQILKSMEIPDKKTIMQDLREGKAYGPQISLKQLNEAIEQQAQGMFIKETIERQGLVQALSQLRLPEIQERVFEQLDFKQVTIQRQQGILKWLQTSGILSLFRHLSLKYCDSLNNTVLKQMDLLSLTRIDLRGNTQLDENTLFLFAQNCPSLDRLNLSENTGLVTTKKKDRAPRFVALQRLYLNNCWNLQEFKIEAPALTVLEMEECKQLSTAEIDLLPQLQKLNVRNALNLRSLEGNILKLVEANLEGCNQLKQAKYITQYPGYSLSVYGFLSKLTAVQLTRCHQLLTKDKSLQQLNLWNNKIGDAGAQALAEMLKVNNTLQKLGLGGNQIGDAGAQALAEMLKIHSTLQQLDLGYNRMGDDGAQALAEMLKINSTLQQLDLGYNRMGDDGAQALAEMLKVNSALQQLNLWNNKIGTVGTQALASMLKVNTTLQRLDLHNNRIGDTGAQALAEMLKVNSTLQQLNLRNNKIGDTGALRWWSSPLGDGRLDF